MATFTAPVIAEVHAGSSSAGRNGAPPSLAELKERSKVTHIDSHFGLKSWLHAAHRTRNIAQDADNRGEVAEAYVGYRKTANLLRHMLDHPEFTQHNTHKSSAEYYSYMDLKSKIHPTRSRMSELETTIAQQEEEHKRASKTGGATNSSTSGKTAVNGDHASLAAPLQPQHSSSSNVSNGHTPRPSSTSSASTTQHPSQLIPGKAAPPPIPPSSSKPAYALQSPSSPAFQQTPTQTSKPASTAAAHGRVSSGLRERMAALQNAGLRGLSGHHHSSDSSSSSHTHAPHDASGARPQPPPVAPKPAVNGVSSLRSPTSYNHYGEGTSGYSRSSETPESSLAISQPSTLPSAYSQESEPHETWPSYGLNTKASSSQLRNKVASPPLADPDDHSDRPGSAPPAAGGPPDASGPATSTSFDLDQLPTDAAAAAAYESATGSILDAASPPLSGASAGADADMSAAHELRTRFTAMASPSSLDNFADRFADRFPDVEQAGFDISSSAGQHSGVVRPFHPAPSSSSTDTFGQAVQNGRASRSESQSTVRTHSTGGSTSTAPTSRPTSNLIHSQNAYGGPPSKSSSPSASGPLSKPPRPLPKPPSLPSLPNRSATNIDAQDLWRFLSSPEQPGRPSILLLDVRTRREFSNGHIRGAVVCIEPFTLSSNSSAASIENSLIVSPESERKAFHDRAAYDLIVIYDKSTRALPSRNSTSSTSSTPRNGPVTFRNIAEQVEDGAVNARTLAGLVSAIYELNFSDQGKRLKRSPLLLVGGFEAWAREIGDQGIQKETYVQHAPLHGYHHHSHHSHSSQGHSPSPDPHQQQQQSKPDYTATPPLQPSRPNGVAAPYEDDYQAMLANRAQAENQLAQKSYGSDAMASSPDVKRQHRKAVLSGDGNIASPPPLHTATMPGPPPPAYAPGMPMPPVAVHRTGPASPYEAYPNSSFRNTSYPQRQGSGEYFEGYPSPPRNNYQTSQPPMPFNQSYQPSRPIEYPTVQQRQQRFMDTAIRSTPTIATDIVNNVQRPPPALARAASSYIDSPTTPLHLYQSGDYLTSPAHGNFPKQMTALGDGIVGLTGLKNLGNTCYMNSMVQCMSATIPLARFFKEGSYKRAINRTNFLGTKGVLADAVAQLVQSLWSEQYSFLAPVTFRDAICRFAPQFKGSDQHDSQEFLAFMLDGLHEDLNLVLEKPPPIEFTPEREKELETLPTQIAAEREWNIYLRRDDSIIVRLLQGQYKSQLRCLTCGATSTTYNTFMYLSLPIPAGKGVTQVTLSQCIEFFTQPEVLDGDDAWNCPKCKKPRRASKALTISRLPPILLIHLKRFSFHGPFTDKIDTAVMFPVRGLDMKPHLPPPLAPKVKAKYEHAIGHTIDDPVTCMYDLHAVSNHFGNLSSGHYTAFVRSRGHWHDLNDSKIGRLTEAQVASANKSAYTLWYSRRA